MRRRRVLLECLSVRGRPTGVAQGIVHLLTALADESCDHDYTVLSGSAEPLGFLAGRPGWDVRVVPKAGSVLRRAWWVQRRLPDLARELDADLVHHLQFPASLSGPCPTVATVHDLAWRSWPDTVPRARRLYYRLLVPAGLGRARRIAVNSEATAAEVRRFFPALADRIRVTPHGTPPWALAAGPPETDPEGAPRHFLFVGTREPRKNLPRVVAAYGAFLETARAGGGGTAAPLPRLRIVGPPGWGEAEMQRALAASAVEGMVDLTGYCSEDRLIASYRQAVALVFPSLHEGFGLPILEAMALGVPVITSDRGAPAEIAGSAGLLVSPEDVTGLARAMHRLTTEPDDRARLIGAGLDRCREWTWRATAEATRALYDEVLDQVGPVV